MSFSGLNRNSGSSALLGHVIRELERWDLCDKAVSIQMILTVDSVVGY